MASSEIITVTQSRSSTPNRSVPPSTLHSRENRKLTWSSAIAGIALGDQEDRDQQDQQDDEQPRPRREDREDAVADPAPPAAAGDRPRTEDRPASPSNVPMAVGCAEPIGNAESSPRSAQSIDSPPIDGGGSGSADAAHRPRAVCRLTARVVARAAMAHRLPIRHRSSSPPVTKRPAGLPPVTPGARRSLSIVGYLEAALSRQLILATSA